MTAETPKATSPQKYFTEDQLNLVNKETVPEHIAIIPDGNRRWAIKQNTTHAAGHEQGADIIIDIVKAAKELGVQAITFYTFSTENWLRPQEEVEALMWLIECYLENQKEKMLSEGIRLLTIGDDTKLSPSLKETIKQTKEKTKECREVDLILAINYGGRDDVTRSLKKILKKVEKKEITPESITEKTITEHLDTHLTTDPELMIRTSGEMRISNFLIWQLSYSEIFVTDVLWPDFTPEHLFQAILQYQQRNRRLGN